MTERELGFLREHFEGEELKNAIKRLEGGEPLGYIIGEWYFWDETFILNEGCLIPRPDTELVVEKALKLLPPDAKIADLCTGSGCIGLSILKHSDAYGYLCDISENALAAAKKNAHRIGLENRCEIFRCDVLEEVPFPESSLDLIVSNPPYIRSEVIPTLAKQLQYEPKIALDGGVDGLLFYRRLIDEYLNCLKDGGYMILEIGFDQREDILCLCPNAEIFKDYGGNDRVAIIKKI